MPAARSGALRRTNNDANQVTLRAAGAHVLIIRAMDRHQDDAQVQELACRRQGDASVQ